MQHKEIKLPNEIILCQALFSKVKEDPTPHWNVPLVRRMLYIKDVDCNSNYDMH